MHDDVRQAAARIAHEVNRAYCELAGDHTQEPWDEMTEWKRNSTLIGVDMFLADIATTPEQLHESWLANHVAEGWVYGETKDPEKKTHPCLVPYDELPITQRLKDIMFSAVVRGVATSATAASAKLNRYGGGTATCRHSVDLDRVCFRCVELLSWVADPSLRPFTSPSTQDPELPQLAGAG